MSQSGIILETSAAARPAPATVVQKARQLASDLLQGAADKASSVMAALTGKRKLTRLGRVMIAAQQDLTIEAARRSDVIDITYVSTDPDKGKEFLARFLDLYRQAHLRAYQSPSSIADCGPQCDQMPNFASRNHSGIR